MKTVIMLAVTIPANVCRLVFTAILLLGSGVLGSPALFLGPNIMSLDDKTPRTARHQNSGRFAQLQAENRFPVSTSTAGCGKLRPTAKLYRTSTNCPRRGGVGNDEARNLPLEGEQLGFGFRHSF